jgi:hypothetical protein
MSICTRASTVRRLFHPATNQQPKKLHYTRHPLLWRKGDTVVQWPSPWTRPCWWHNWIWQWNHHGIWKMSPLHPTGILWPQSWASTSYTFHERDGGGKLGRRRRPLGCNADNSSRLEWWSRRANQLKILQNTDELLETWNIICCFIIWFWLANSRCRKLIILSDEINQSVFIRPNTTLLLCIFLFCIFLLYRTGLHVEVQIRILLKDK